MIKITDEMVKCVYQISKQVHSNQILVSDAKFEVNKQCGMHVGSAGNYIDAFLCMIEGKRCYKRTINLFATEYYLEHIGIDYGREAQIKAAEIVKDHVKYYESIASYQEQIDNIADKYLEGVGASQMHCQSASHFKTDIKPASHKKDSSATIKELGAKLHAMYDMPGVNKAAMVHLFGIISADVIRENNMRIPDIVKVAGLQDSYKAEVAKGVKLAKYVQLKDEYKDIF